MSTMQPLLVHGASIKALVDAPLDDSHSVLALSQSQSLISPNVTPVRPNFPSSFKSSPRRVSSYSRHRVSASESTSKIVKRTRFRSTSSESSSSEDRSPLALPLPLSSASNSPDRKHLAGVASGLNPNIIHSTARQHLLTTRMTPTPTSSTDSPDIDSSSSRHKHAYTEERDSESDWEEDSEEEMDYTDDTDSTMTTHLYQQGPSTWYNEPKVIVPLSKLVELLEICSKCGKKCFVGKPSYMGSAVTFRVVCGLCTQKRQWSNTAKAQSQPLINLLVASGILFSGSLPTKFLRALAMIGVQVMSRQTFHQYQKKYLHGAIRNVYEAEMESLLQSLPRPLSLNGDGRFDSPGHSALYGLYTLMDAKSSKIVVASLLKSTETTSSGAMELEGLKRCKQYLDDNQVQVSRLTTDRHISINAYMRDKWPAVSHFFDTWHISKAISKKLKKLSGARVANKQIGKWTHAITNHLYKVVSESDPESVLRRDWWKSAANHACNIHDHQSDIFPACKHGPREEEKLGEDGDTYVRDWIDPDSEVAASLRKILWDEGLLKGIDRASMETTSELESFHAAINRNAPKMEGFGYAGMLSRSQITVLHHNENCQRPNAKKLNGDDVIVAQRAKATGQKPTVRFLKEKATYVWVRKLFMEVDKALVVGGISYSDPKPPTLASRGDQYENVTELLTYQTQRRSGAITKPHYVKPTDRGLGTLRRMSRGRRGPTPGRGHARSSVEGASSGRGRGQGRRRAMTSAFMRVGARKEETGSLVEVTPKVAADLCDSK